MGQIAPIADSTVMPAAPVSIQVFDSVRRQAHDLPIIMEGTGPVRVQLRSLHGAHRTQIPIIQNDAVAFRLEVACEGDEPIVLELSSDRERGLLAHVVGRRTLTLPGDERHAPPPPLCPSVGLALDLCFLLDATVRVVDDPRGVMRVSLLLADPARRDAHAEVLMAFADHLRSSFSEVRVCVLGFADTPLEDVEALDLKPLYLVYPETASRRLRPTPAETLRVALLAVPASPGGDFVDGLGDALAAAVDIGWRPAARKVLVLSGDSPGFSVVHPPPRYADAHVRRHDVDAEAARLHARGVEIVTIFHQPAQSAHFGIANPMPFVSFAREQYARLASRAGFAFELASLDPRAAADCVRSAAGPIGGDAALALFEGVVEG
jgi:hypothetical protein